MKNFIAISQVLLAISLFILVIYGGYRGIRSIGELFMMTSPLTEEGMQWQREHNPEYMKAAALERLAKAQEEANKSR